MACPQPHIPAKFCHVRAPSAPVLPVLFFCVLALFCPGCVATLQEERNQQQLRQLNEDGVFLYQKGAYEKARESFDLALTFKPDDPALLYNVGQCYDRLGQTKKAEEQYRLCLARDPDHAPCRQALSRLLLLEGRRGEATEAIEAWLASRPKRADAYVQDAWRWQQDGDLLKAQARLQQALQLEPHNVEALTRMGVLYELLERPDRALVLYETALHEAPQRDDLRERVNMLLAKGVQRPLPD